LSQRPSIVLVVVVDASAVAVLLEAVRAQVLIIAHQAVVGLHEAVIIAGWASVRELVCKVVLRTFPFSSSLADNFLVANHIARDQDVFLFRVHPIFIRFKRRKLQQLRLHLIVRFHVLVPGVLVYDHVHFVTLITCYMLFPFSKV